MTKKTDEIKRTILGAMALPPLWVGVTGLPYQMAPSKEFVGQTAPAQEGNRTLESVEP